MNKLRPLGDRVLVKPLDSELKTKSGLVLPESAQEKSNEAKVIAVGPGKLVDGKLVTPEIKVGDRVIYKANWGDKIKVGDEEYEIVDGEQILAVVGGE